MKKRRVFPFLLTILLVIALFANKQTRSPVSAELHEEFFELVEVTNMNKDLRITQHEIEWDRFGSKIQIIYQNIGQKPIFLSTDEGTKYVKIFSIKDNQWIELEDSIKFINVDDEKGFVISTSKTPFETRSTMVHPLFPHVLFDPDKKEFIRILIKGEYIEGDVRTGIFAGAYVDLYVSP